MTDEAPKCALIVDDSQTARRVLGQVLEQHHIRVEMAGSAEEALSFLDDTRPDVIFMDHLMPGMDGFQAVRAIKNNPATATIPIMMYTSQAGELYVGQARALGAVGVLPKQIKPVQVADTLKSLNLIPMPVIDTTPAESSVDHEVIPDADVGRTLAEVERMMEPADWGELHTWFEQMLRHHQDTLRADIESSVSRLLRASAVEREAPPPEVQHGFFGKELSMLRNVNATTLLVAALALFVATFFWIFIETQEEWRELFDQNAQLIGALEAGRDMAPIQSRLNAAGRFAANTTDLREVVRDLEWQANSRATYGPDDIPFGDKRLETVDRLVADLRAAGFTGVVQLDSHVGDFCLVQAADGAWVPAAQDLAIRNCERIGLGAENAFANSAKQSIAFANYLAALNGDATEDIRIVVIPHGNSSPMLPYPERRPAGLAGDWNQVALQNNRVQVRVIADDGLDRRIVDTY